MKSTNSYLPSLVSLLLVVKDSYSFTPTSFHTAHLQKHHAVPSRQTSLLHQSLLDEAVATTKSNVPEINNETGDEPSNTFSYVQFAKRYPFYNNLMIATAKTAAADLLAQTVISQTPLMEVDMQRSLLFCLFGALYLGMCQSRSYLCLQQHLHSCNQLQS